LAWERLEGLGAQFEPQSTTQLRQFIASELEIYGRIVREAGIQPQ
jgi:hypothetical protein